MLAKSWKRILLIVVILLCLINVIIKLSKIIPFDKTIADAKNSLKYMQTSRNIENKTNNVNIIENKI